MRTTQGIVDPCHAWVDRYVASLAGRQALIFDIDSTDNPTHGRQQWSMFNRYYGHWMYNELFFHNGQTGQIIVPVLRPGNSHSHKWYVATPRRVTTKMMNRCCYYERNFPVGPRS